MLVPREALGISLYDVVRLSKAGYADQDIIRLIGVTESQFVLDPDTLVKLRQEGVSEKVIQALIEAREPARELSEEGPLKEEPEPAHPHSPTAGRRSPPTAELPGQTVVGAFAFFPFQEAGSGHGGAHQHYGLTINEVPVLVLRSEAGLPGIEERARIVAGLLNENVRSADGGFFAASGGTAAVWYRDPSSAGAVRILEVTRGDVDAYQSRSLGAVSAERLAAYWAALLDDYTRLFLFARPAAQLVELHLGGTLIRVHEQVKSAVGEAEGGPPLGSPRLLALLDHLSTEDKEHLIGLSTRVPIEFRGPERAPR